MRGSMRMIGVPVSIIFGNTETCGICTHSVGNGNRCIRGYVAVPFVCNSLRQSERNTLLIEGSNITECNRMVELDGRRWFDSGISVLFLKDFLIVHKMPSTFCSSMPA